MTEINYFEERSKIWWATSRYFFLSLFFTFFFEFFSSASSIVELCWTEVATVLAFPLWSRQDSHRYCFKLGEFGGRASLSAGKLWFQSAATGSVSLFPFKYSTDATVRSSCYFPGRHRWPSTPISAVKRGLLWSALPLTGHTPRGGGEIRIECHGANYEFSVYKNFSTERYQIWPNRVFQLKLKLTLFWLAAWITGCCFCCRGITIFFCFETLCCWCCCCCCSSCSFLLLKA